MNLLKSIKLLVAAAAISLATSAFAYQEFSLSLPGGTGSFEQSGIGGVFDHHWTFNVASLSNGSYDTDYLYAVTKKNVVVSEISGYDVSLWTATNTQVTTTESIDGLLGTALIGAGNYYLKVTGTGAGLAGGYYWGEMTVTPVPEPGEWALMLSGFGLIALMVRRRTANAS